MNGQIINATPTIIGALPEDEEPTTSREVVWYLYENNNQDSSPNDDDFSGTPYAYSAVTYYEGSYSVQNNGSNEIYTPDLGSTDSITICAWIYATSDASNDQRSWENDPATGNGLYMRLGMLGNGDLYLYADNTQIWAAANEFPLNTWAHLAITYTTTTGAGQVYLDGDIVGSQQTTDDGAYLDGSWYMMDDPATGHPLYGYMDDFRVYHEILPESDVEWIIANPGDALE